MAILLSPNVDIRTLAEGEYAPTYRLEVSQEPDAYDADGNPLWYFKIDQRYVAPPWLTERLDGWIRRMGFVYKGLDRAYTSTHNEVWGIVSVAEGTLLSSVVLLEEGKENYQAQAWSEYQKRLTP